MVDQQGLPQDEEWDATRISQALLREYNTNSASLFIDQCQLMHPI